MASISRRTNARLLKEILIFAMLAKSHDYGHEKLLFSLAAHFPILAQPRIRLLEGLTSRLTMIQSNAATI